MSTTTTHFSLVKPAVTDVISQTILDLASDMDAIDAELYLGQTHRSSSTAHAAQNITYSGEVTGRTEVKGAIDDLQVQLDSAIIGSGTSPAEVVSAREGIRGESNTVLNDRLDRMESNLGQITTVSTSPTTLTVDQRGIILVDTSIGNITLNLPAIASNSTKVITYIIKKTTSDSNTVIVTPNGAEKIDGASTFTLSYQNNLIKILNNGSNWSIESNIETLEDLIFYGTTPKLVTNTSDGADSYYIGISGGGDVLNTRGGNITVYGNENASTGSIKIEAGNVSGGDIDFYTANTFRGKFDYSGNLNIDNLTASRVVVTDASKNLASSTVTSTTLGYLDIGSSLTSLLAGKEASFSKGDISETTSSVLTISNGTGRLYGGTGLTIQVKQANNSQSGYLSSSDYSNLSSTPLSRYSDIGNLTEATSSVLNITGGTGSTIGNVSIQVKQASSIQSGYLSSSDYNNLASTPISRYSDLGNLTETTSSVLTITGGTKATIGNVSIQVKQANTTTSGYLSNTDWNTFNGKQNALSFSNLVGTTDQISLSASGTGVLVGSTSITLSLPQSISTTSVTQFGGLGLGVASSSGVFKIAQGTDPVAFGTADQIGLYATAGANCTLGIMTEQAVTRGLLPVKVNGTSYNMPVTHKGYASAAFSSPGSTGTFDAFGYYKYATSSVTLTQASTTQTFGTSNVAYSGRAFIVANGAGTASGGSGAVTITVSGTSISHSGTRTPGDSEVICTDITTLVANRFVQTSKTWSGTITYTINVGGTGHTAYSATFNYGMSAMTVFNQCKVKLTELEIFGRAGANDSSFDITLYHQKNNDTSWTYAASGFVPGGTVLAKWSTFLGTEKNLATGEPFHWHVTGMTTTIDGTLEEGVVIRITTGANNSVESSTLRIYYEYIT